MGRPSSHGFTVLGTFRTCPYKCFRSWLADGQGYEPFEIQEKFTFGGSMHKIRAAVNLGKSKDEAMAIGVKEARKRWLLKPDGKLPDHVEPSLYRMLLATLELDEAEGRYEPYVDDTGPWVERRVAVTISGIEYSVTVDMLTVVDGIFSIVDYKYTGLPLGQLFPQYFLDFQTTGYCWVGQHILNKPVKSVIMECGFKGRGKVPLPEIKRETFLRDAEEIGKFMHETLYWQNRLRDCQASGFWPRNTDACVGPWGTCEHHPHCVSRGQVDAQLYRLREEREDE